MDRSSAQSPQLLLMVAGAKGAIGTTLAVMAAAMEASPQLIVPYMTTADKFSHLGCCESVAVTGWDRSTDDLATAIERHGVLTEGVWRPYESKLSQAVFYEAPEPVGTIAGQVEKLIGDIDRCKKRFPDAKPVLINLLPAACDDPDPDRYKTMADLLSQPADRLLPDLAYITAAIKSGVSVVNFSPNTLEIPVICDYANEKKVSIAGRDGKTGQTYFKVVLASALKARGLYVDGWYSLNILGNADGLNLMDPGNACGKLKNKTHLLDEILGYPVGERYGRSTHKVQIDYYPPRGDAKEAWDVIDVTGVFGMPMSLRLNLQGRDSILAAPLALDLARWVAALQTAGISGPVPKLGFYFKKPVGVDAPLTFEQQLAALATLEARIEAKIDG
jgi:myo-inositol-1-phosphate synthase